MDSDESSTTEPLYTKKKIAGKDPANSYRRTLKILFMAKCIMLLIMAFLIANNLIVIFSYMELKHRVSHEAGTIAAANEDLNTEKQNLENINEELKRELERIKEENAKILEELSQADKEKEQLARTNRELTDDNIALQNSLKMAASAGVKPQNYTRFDGLNSRGTVERGEYVGKFLGTAYTPSKKECGNNKGITCSGEPIIPGVTLAVDREYWPLGTVFYIRGLGYAVAMDTGSAIKGRNRFDFAVFDRDFARELGARYWDVYLVRLGNGKVEDISF